MAFPNYQTFILPLLDFVSDGQPHTLEEAAQALVIKHKLSEVEANKWLSGVQSTRIIDRLSRASTQLRKAQLIEGAGRNKVRITERGRRELEKPPERMDVIYLQKYPEFNKVTTNRDSTRISRPSTRSKHQASASDIELDDHIEMTATPSLKFNNLIHDWDIEPEEVIDWPEDEDENGEEDSEAEQPVKTVRHYEDVSDMGQPMNDQDYKDYLSYLFDQNVVIPRTLTRRRRGRFLESSTQAEETLEGLRRSMGIVNYIWEQLDNDADIYKVFREEALRETVNSTRKGVVIGYRLANETGLLKIVTEHFDEIVEGMRVDHFPKEEIDILRDLGVKNPRVAVQATVYLLKRRRRLLRESEYYDLARELVMVSEMLPIQYERSISPQLSGVEGEKRRSWKTLGGIIEGAGMVIGNVLMVINPLDVSISAPEVQSYGAILSVTGGVGKIVAAFGELRKD